MRTVLTTALLFTLALPTALPAEVVLRPHDPEAAARPIRQPANPLTPPAEKTDKPEETFIVPFFEVDTNNEEGTTTFFAVSNVSYQTVDVAVRYQALDGTELRQDFVRLGALETLVRNVRFVGGLPADPDGFARGFIVVLQNSVMGTSLLVGDYFQVDPGNAFATGQRMASLDDLCIVNQVRFLDFGSGTELRLLINEPQGSDPARDPASVVVYPNLQDGTVLQPTDIYTDDYAFEVSASDFTTSAFGTLLFEFSNSSGGLVYAEYSAFGQFSVGLNGACTVPSP